MPIKDSKGFRVITPIMKDMKRTSLVPGSDITIDRRKMGNIKVNIDYPNRFLAARGVAENFREAGLDDLDSLSSAKIEIKVGINEHSINHMGGWTLCRYKTSNMLIPSKRIRQRANVKSRPVVE